jgi:hypothetical protein
MAKAAAEGNTRRIPLREAHALVVKVHGSARLAEEQLLEWLGEGRVRWACQSFRGCLLDFNSAPIAGAPGAGDPKFWCFSLEIDWAESWARVKYQPGGYTAYGITVSWADIVAQLPCRPARGAPPQYQRDAIRAVAEKILRRGVPSKKSQFFDDVREECSKKRLVCPPPGNDKTMRAICGDLYDDPQGRFA